MKYYLNLLIMSILIIVCHQSTTFNNQANNSFNSSINQLNNNSFLHLSSNSKLNFTSLTKIPNINLIENLINKLVYSLNNQTLIRLVQNSTYLNRENNLSHLINELTGNLKNVNPEMNSFLDEVLLKYLDLISKNNNLNQLLILMNLLENFNYMFSTNELLFSKDILLNKTNLLLTYPSTNIKTELIQLDLNRTLHSRVKLARMEFITDTIISLLIGKLIGLKVGYFAGKYANNLGTFKKSCCGGNTWPPENTVSIVSNGNGMSSAEVNDFRKNIYKKKANTANRVNVKKIIDKIKINKENHYFPNEEELLNDEEQVSNYNDDFDDWYEIPLKNRSPERRNLKFKFSN